MDNGLKIKPSGYFYCNSPQNIPINEKYYRSDNEILRHDVNAAL